MKAGAAILLLASPVPAQDLIDYDLLMRQNADRVVVTTDAQGHAVRTLDMGDGVTVRCDENGCVGMDLSENGALGCAFAIVTELRAFAEVCDTSVDATTKTAMAVAFDAVGQIAVRNAVPPRPMSYLQDVLDAAKDRLRADHGADLAGWCRAELETDVGGILREIVAAWQAGPQRPKPDDDRLPVMNPCL